MLFNPLEQERLSMVYLLVSSPQVRVLSEEGQPLAVQISPQWSSATDMVADVFQVSAGRGGGPQPSLLTRGLSPGPDSACDTSLPPSCFLPRLGTGVLGRGLPRRKSLLGLECVLKRKVKFGGAGE